MKMVCKFELLNLKYHTDCEENAEGDVYTVMLPKGANLLYAKEDGMHSLCLWAWVETTEPTMEGVKIGIIGDLDSPEWGELSPKKHLGSGVLFKNLGDAQITHHVFLLESKFAKSLREMKKDPFYKGPKA